MSFIQRFVYGSVKKTALPSYFDQSLLRKPSSFQFKIHEITAMKNIADWYTDNFIVTSSCKSWHFLSESTQLYRAYNAHYLRKLFIRLFLYLSLIYACNTLLIEKPFLDWQDYHDLKFDQKLYGDLEEGGDEGGDDD